MKYGLYDDFGMHKDVLSDLMLFYSSTEKKLISLDEYLAKMGEEQKYIYYAPGETVEKIDLLPQTEAAKAARARVMRGVLSPGGTRLAPTEAERRPVAC